MAFVRACWLAMVLVVVLGGPLQAQSPSPSPELVLDLPTPVVPERGVQWWQEPVPFLVASAGGLSGQDRAEQMRDRLDAIADRADAAPDVAVDEVLGLTVVRVGTQALITVLPEDLPPYYRNLPPDRLRLAERQVASQWAQILQQDLDERVHRRSAEYGWWAACLVALLTIGAIFANAFVRWFARRFLSTPAWSFRAMVWLMWLAICLSLLPQLQPVQYLLVHGVMHPLWALIIAALVSSVVFQVSRALLHRYFRSLADVQERRNALQAQRLASLEGAALFALQLAIFLGAVLFVLSDLGVSLSHLVAGAGLLGAALTLVFQDLLRDITAGANILAEDQFAVGDWIEAGATQGTVEAFHLRATRVRVGDGTLVILPNSELRVVRNHSRDWSQMDYRVVVDLAADGDAALKCLAEEAQALAEERPDKVLEPPQVLGFEALGPDGLTLRLALKTPPLQQSEVARDLNRRVSARLRREGIALAARRHEVRLTSEGPAALHAEPPRAAGG